jgi:AcrR family transcriptional regulator
LSHLDDTREDLVADSGSGRRGRRPKTSREAIVTQALAIIDGEGIQALSMRRLGKDLGVDPMAIYNHISGKPELLDAVVDRVMSEVDLSVDDASAPWQERVRRVAGAYRAALCSHPNVLPVIASGRARMFGGLAPADQLLSIFEAAGVPRPKWLIAVNAFSSWILGSALMEMTTGEGAAKVIVEWAANAPTDRYPHVGLAIATHEPTDSDAYFRYGVISLIGGLNAIAKADGGSGKRASSASAARKPDAAS